MHKRVLTNVQRQDLHAILLKHGVDPARTRWSNAKMGWTNAEVETLEAGLCHFLFGGNSDGGMNVHVKPAPGGAVSDGYVGQSWAATLELFDGWAFEVAREFTHEDPWAQYAMFLPPQEFVSTATDNAPFTHSEAEQLSNGLKLFLDHIKKELPDYSKVEKSFDEQFKRLEEQAKKGAGRIDWRNQFLGMIISLCLTLSLSPETGTALWHSWMAFYVDDTPLLK